jgi:hypothetical protein
MNRDLNLQADSFRIPAYTSRPTCRLRQGQSHTELLTTFHQNVEASLSYREGSPAKMDE